MAGQGECANCKRLQAEVDSLKARLSTVEGQLQRVMRQAGRFSRDQRKSAPKKPGRKKGEGSFKGREAPPEDEIDTLIDEGRKFSDPDKRRFAKRLRKQRRHLFTFLTHDGVEATNNRAERGVRPAVIARKIGGCNKTERGAETPGTQYPRLPFPRPHLPRPTSATAHPRTRHLLIKGSRTLNRYPGRKKSQTQARERDPAKGRSPRRGEEVGRRRAGAGGNSLKSRVAVAHSWSTASGGRGRKAAGEISAMCL